MIFIKKDKKDKKDPEPEVIKFYQFLDKMILLHVVRSEVEQQA